MNLKENSFEKIIAGLHDGLYLVDKKRVITYWNRAAENITGFKAEEVVGRPCSDNILTHVDCAGHNLCKGKCPLAHSLKTGIPGEAEVFLHHKDGHRIPVSVRVSTITDDNGTITGGIELFTDISTYEYNKIRIQELEKLAYLDQLTQLANRNCLNGELERFIDDYKKRKIPFGILFIDIDKFKKINDTYGHLAGDKVLTMISTTFSKNARPYDIYGRWGGEEFVAIINNIKLPELEKLGDRIRMLVEHSYTINDGNKISVTISLGGTIIAQNDTIDTIIERADKLLYTSKQTGRNKITVG